MDTLFVTIDYPQANKDGLVEYFEKKFFLNTNGTLRLIVDSVSMKIKLQNIISNLSIELSIKVFRELISKLKEICNVNIRYPYTINQQNDHVKISLVTRRNYRPYRDVIVLDEESVCKLIAIFSSEIEC